MIDLDLDFNFIDLNFNSLGSETILLAFYFNFVLLGIN